VLQDGSGLYLEVRPTGAKFWRYRYWLTPEKDGRYTIGEYPSVSLSEARRERERVRELVKQGIHPTQEKKTEKLRQSHERANTFEAIAREWLERKKGKWSAYSHKGASKNSEFAQMQGAEKISPRRIWIICKQEIFSATQHNQPLSRRFWRLSGMASSSISWDTTKLL
jgi:hypothetical protein